jgi:hypothetical protein
MANRLFTPDRHSLADPFPAPAAWRGDTAAALFSPCGRYRWWLVRHWCPERSPVLFVGLNPSTADAGRDDPTLRRLCGLAGCWGHGGVLVLNLFSRVGSDPAQLRKSPQPVGEHTDAWMVTALGWLGAQASNGSGPPPRVWVGWGHQGGLHGRCQQVLPLLQCWKGDVVCLGITRHGQPRHPLFTRASQPPLPVPVSPSPCPASPVVTPST